MQQDAQVDRGLAMIDMIALHEAGHATVARLLGIEVTAVSVDPDDAYVTTRHRRGGDAGPGVAILERLAIVDLVGTVIEPPPASATDQENAMRRCAEVVRLKLDIADDEVLNASQFAKVRALNRRLPS